MVIEASLPLPSADRRTLTPRPPGVGAFQFVVVSTLRAAQLIRGCRPRVDGGHKPTVTARMEVSEGTGAQLPASPDAAGEGDVTEQR